MSEVERSIKDLSNKIKKYVNLMKRFLKIFQMAPKKNLELTKIKKIDGNQISN